MKRLSNIVTFFLAVVVLTSCGGLNKMKKEAGNINYTVTPKVLEAHAGEVEVTVTGTFPEKYFNKNASVELIPVLVYEGGETAFNSITLQGESVEANDKVVNYAPGGKFTHTDKVPFEEGMRVSELMLRGKATMKSNSVDLDPIKLADGVIATSTLVAEDADPVMVGDKFQRVIPEAKEADIHYVINKADVRNTELRAEDVQMLKEYIAEANKKSNYDLKGAVVSAYASPDGEYDLNEKLAEKRKGTAESYLTRELKKAKVEKAQSDDFLTLLSTAEDWDGFKALMEKSDIKDKELILRVLSMYNDPAVREREIKNISQAFEVIKDDVLPKLRRSKLTVNVDVIGFSDEEISAFIDSNSDTLNLEEILYAATLTDDDNKKLEIYQLAAKRYPGCFRAHNNIGYVQVKLGNVSEAKSAFEKAKGIQDNDVAKNNLGFIALMEKDYDKAKELFTSVSAPTKETNYGLGILAVKDGQYQEAVNYFGTEASFNAALAQLLSGDTEASLRTLGNVESDCPMLDYLKAVIGARKGSDDMVLNNLRTAISKKAELKDVAKTDMEFASYFENDTFKSIIQ